MLKFISLLKGPPGGWADIPPQTLVPIKSHSYKGYLSKLRDSLEALGIEMTPLMEEEAQDRMCLQLPEGWCRDPENPQPYESALKRLGRSLWKRLHDKARNLPLQLTEGDQTELKSWLSLWERAIPNYSRCNCQKNWVEARTSLQPVFDTGPGFLEWTIQAHDLVNLKLGKTTWAETQSLPLPG